MMFNTPYWHGNHLRHVMNRHNKGVVTASYINDSVIEIDNIVLEEYVSVQTANQEVHP